MIALGPTTVLKHPKREKLMMRMSRRFRQRGQFTGLVMVAVLTATLMTAPAAASDGSAGAVTESESETMEHIAWPDDITSPDDTTPPANNALLCVFGSRTDHPHRSGGDVSVHGWWVYIWGVCPQFAWVKVWLQQEECPTPYWCRWVNRGPQSTKMVRQGGGAGNRATARVACTSTQTTRWRGAVDVDLIGYFDDPLVEYGVPASVQCRV